MSGGRLPPSRGAAALARARAFLARAQAVAADAAREPLPERRALLEAAAGRLRALAEFELHTARGEGRVEPRAPAA